MASSTTKKKGRPTKAELDKRRRQEQLETRQKQKREQTAIILFAVGILLTALAFIEGESIWKTVHDGFFGVFGVLAYIAGPFAFWFAIAYAFGKNPALPIMIKGTILFFAISGALLIFGKSGIDGTFITDIAILFNDGKLLKGGGAVSALLGWTLRYGCGETAAKVVISALIFVLIMMITGKTVVDLVNGVRKPIDAIKTQTRRDPENVDEGIEDSRPARANREPSFFSAFFHKKSRFEIDVPIEPEPIENPELGYDENITISTDTVPDPLPESSVKLLPIDFSTEGKKKASQIAREAASIKSDGMSSIDIPLGPDFEIEAETGIDDIDIIVNTHSIPTGPAAELVSDLLKQQETVSGLFTDFTDDNIAEPIKTYATYATRVPIREKDFSRRMEESFKEAGEAQKEDIPHLFDTEFERKPTQEDNIRKTVAEEYHFPPLSLLDRQKAENAADMDAKVRSNAEALVSTLDSFGVKTKLVNVTRGPSVTRYELQPETGVRLNKIVNLADDLALNLAAEGVRIEAPIPGKAAVGIEIPNKSVSVVNLRSVIESDTFRNSKAPLTFAIGKDISGAVRIGDISKMPHLLIAGSTGMGKSVCINSMLISLVYKSAPKDLQLILIDPKMVEFTSYTGLPHLYIPVVTDPKKAAGALGSAVSEMMKRYRLFSQYGSRNIDEYNALVQRKLDAQESNDAVTDTDEGEPLEKKARIVIVIDELADLMMTSPNEVEDAICRIAQMGRAAGINLVVATQRPSVDVITGTIKNNIPTRIAFKVSSQIDSRTIIDGSGAEKLIGRGDMLFLPVGQSKPVRIQGCYVSDSEVNKVVEFLKQFAVASYNEQFIKEMEENAANAKGKSAPSDADSDPMLEEAIEVVVEAGQASTSQLQRRLKLGYGRAARIMDEMEKMGIIGQPDGSKPREVHLTRQQWQERLMNRD
ncbi:MAG: DNA translocase FtsK [Oscillospiraceae bacterium]